MLEKHTLGATTSAKGTEAGLREVTSIPRFKLLLPLSERLLLLGSYPALRRQNKLHQSAQQKMELPPHPANPFM